MGNDAAHEIKLHKPEQISVALKIVDHLINSLYILEKEVQGQLDTTISAFPDFLQLLQNRIKTFSKGDEVPLNKILQGDTRRFQKNLGKLEDELKDKISRSDIDFVTLGKVDNYANSPDKLQHYIIQVENLASKRPNVFGRKAIPPLAVPPTKKSVDTTPATPVESQQ